MRAWSSRARGVALTIAAALAVLTVSLAMPRPASAQFDQLDRYNAAPRDPYGYAPRQRPVRPRGDPGYGYRVQPQAYPQYYGQP